MLSRWQWHGEGSFQGAVNHSILTVHSKDKKENHEEILKCIWGLFNPGNVFIVIWKLLYILK